MIIRELIGAAIGVAILIAMAAEADASPFLTCDPYPANPTDSALNVVTFIITGNVPGSPVSVQARIGTGGMQYLYYDLATLTNNTYTVTAAAVNGYGQEGAQSLPFTFTKGVPTAPSGLSIVPSIPSPLP
jgi:hypothetical protein